MTGRRRPVAVVEYLDPHHFHSEVTGRRLPAVVRGCPLGASSLTWTSEYLRENLSGLVRPVHVTTETNMNFVEKNFKYASMDLGEVVARAAEGGEEREEKYYLRAVSEENPRTKPVRLEEDFPSIARDFSLPAGLVPQERIFSSVLRVSSGNIRLWTHYDVMDNVYCQIVGLVMRKLVRSLVPSLRSQEGRAVVPWRGGEALPAGGQVQGGGH